MAQVRFHQDCLKSLFTDLDFLFTHHRYLGRKRGFSITYSTGKFTGSFQVQFAEFEDDTQGVKRAGFGVNLAIRFAIKVAFALPGFFIEHQIHLAGGKIGLNGVIFEGVGEGCVDD